MLQIDDSSVSMSDSDSDSPTIEVKVENDDDDDVDDYDDEYDSLPNNNGLLHHEYTSHGTLSHTDKKAHHNALERKRRDHIKDSFQSLRDSVPEINGEKASRAMILNKATEYIDCIKHRNQQNQDDIETMRRENRKLQSQLRRLEDAVSTGNFDSLHESEDGIRLLNAMMRGGIDVTSDVDSEDADDGGDDYDSSDDITVDDVAIQPSKKRVRID